MRQRLVLAFPSCGSCLSDPVFLFITEQLQPDKIRQALQHRNFRAPLGHGLIDGVMTDELAGAVAHDPRVVGKTWVACSVVARNLDDVVAVGIEVVPDVFRESLLLVAPRLCPNIAARISRLVCGALFPGCQHVEGVRQRLCNHHASVELQLSFAILACV